MKYSLYGTTIVFVIFLFILAFRGQPTIIPVVMWATLIIVPWVFLYWFIRFVKQYIKNSQR
ncbi:hypothetical protein [Salibacterium sp. K-3]